MANINRYLAWLVVLMTALPVLADTGDRARLDVHEFFLDNGMQFLVVQRPSVPQVACRLVIRAGSALESSGKTGLAHMLEHMLFKGTKNFGTLDYRKDQALQAQIEALYQKVQEEKHKRTPDQEHIQALLKQMQVLRQEVQSLVVPQAFSAQLEKNGAVGVNAFTSRDQTQYTASLPADMIEQWFAIASEQIFEPAWREFYVERDVVQREWAFRYVNNPNGAALLDLNAAAFKAHPYGNPVIGWKSDMQNYTTQDAIDFHQRYYTPTNAAVVIVGDVSAKRIEALANTYFSRYPRGQRAPEQVTREPEQQGPRRSIRYLDGARTPLVRMGFHGPAMGSPEFFALDALTMVLSYGRSARLDQNLVEKGLAQNAWIGNPDNRYGSLVIVGGSPNDPREELAKAKTDDQRRKIYEAACAQLEGYLLNEIDVLKKELVSADELAKIKKLNQRDFIERLRSNEKLASTLATLEVEAGWRYLNSYLDNVARVTPEEIRSAAQHIFTEENRTVAYVIPGGKPDKPPETYTEVRSAGQSKYTVAGPAAFVNHSDYPTHEAWRHPMSFERDPQKISYPLAQTQQISGAPLFFLPDRELPIIDLTLLVKAGEVDIPDAKTGLDAMLSGVLVRGGTQSLAPRQMAEELDRYAMRIGFGVHEEYTSISLSVLKEDWDRGLEMLRDLLTAPRLDDQIISVTKRQLLTGLRRQGGRAEAVVGREALISFFKGHPYGRDPLLGLETIDTLKAADLREFLQTYVRPSNMVIALSGDISLENASQGLRSLLNDLPQGPAPVRQLDPPQPPQPGLALIHKPGQVQAQVSLMMPSERRTHPDFWNVSMLMNVFGGKDSLMYTRLRDDLGLVYSAGFYQTYKWQAGLLAGFIACKADQTGRAISETLQLMSGLHEEVPQALFEIKQKDVLNSFVFNVDTPADLVSVYGHYQMRGEPLDTLEAIQEAFIQATPGKLKQLARAYLTPDRLQIVVVCDKDIVVETDQGKTTLEAKLKALAKELDLPYREIPLR